ncbi:MAG: hypothetical protein ACR2P0_15500 [Acidimicrobiales bacterium]
MTGPRTPLEIGEMSLAIGEYSVGLPPTRTGEQIVEGYLELITLVRANHPEELRDEDVTILAERTGLEESFLRNRVASHLTSLRTV